MPKVLTKPYRSFDKYIGKHTGQRCFIIGSAPSLAEEDLSLLDDEIVFVGNRAFKSLDMGLKKIDYYVMTAEKSHYEAYHKEINEYVKCDRFYASHIAKTGAYRHGPREPFVEILKRKGPELRYMDGEWNIPKKFNGTWEESGTVAFDSSLIAYFMGFTHIYLLGVDLSYSKGQNYFYKFSGTSYQYERDQLMAGIDKTAPHLRQYFHKRGIVWKNLSAGYRNNVHKEFNLMDTGTLNEVIANG